MISRLVDILYSYIDFYDASLFDRNCIKEGFTNLGTLFVQYSEYFHSELILIHYYAIKGVKVEEILNLLEPCDILKTYVIPMYKRLRDLKLKCSMGIIGSNKLFNYFPKKKIKKY